MLKPRLRLLAARLAKPLITAFATTQGVCADSKIRTLMMNRYGMILALVFPLLSQGCAHPSLRQELRHGVPTAPASPRVLAVYEPWFGHPRHIAVGYSSQDPAVIRKQIDQAKGLGISGFVVDWYGDREPFIDRSYALMQSAAGKQKFHVAMMYDETDADDSAPDEATADLTMLHQTYLSPSAPGHEAYLTFEGKPVIFVFPKGRHTDWDKVRASVNKWNPAPLLIYENLPGQYANAFDGYYAWVNPGDKGWAPDGGN